LRRFEILLPRQFNDGSQVPWGLILETVEQLEDRFGAVSSETQIIRGYWRAEGIHYRDNLIRIFMDVDDTEENGAFFIDLKDQLKARFQQLDIWITTYPIESL
jgi:hypothetical protein